MSIVLLHHFGARVGEGRVNLATIGGEERSGSASTQTTSGGLSGQVRRGGRGRGGSGRNERHDERKGGENEVKERVACVIDWQMLQGAECEC